MDSSTGNAPELTARLGKLANDVAFMLEPATAQEQPMKGDRADRELSPLDAVAPSAAKAEDEDVDVIAQARMK